MKLFIAIIAAAFLLNIGCQGKPSEQSAPKKEEKPAAVEPDGKKADAPVVAEPKKEVAAHDLATLDTSMMKMGSISPQTFKRVMGKRKSSVKVCYKKALQKDDKARGDVKLQFSISPTGRVGSVEVIEDTLNYPETTSCLIRVVRKVRFPEEKDGKRVVVEYPFHFVP